MKYFIFLLIIILWFVIWIWYYIQNFNEQEDIKYQEKLNSCQENYWFINYNWKIEYSNKNILNFQTDFLSNSWSYVEYKNNTLEHIEWQEIPFLIWNKINSSSWTELNNKLVPIDSSKFKSFYIWIKDWFGSIKNYTIFSKNNNINYYKLYLTQGFINFTLIQGELNWNFDIIITDNLTEQAFNYKISISYNNGFSSKCLSKNQFCNRFDIKIWNISLSSCNLWTSIRGLESESFGSYFASNDSKWWESNWLKYKEFSQSWQTFTKFWQLFQNDSFSWSKNSNVCWTGYHIPSEEEFTKLYTNNWLGLIGYTVRQKLYLPISWFLNARSQPLLSLQNENAYYWLSSQSWNLYPLHKYISIDSISESYEIKDNPQSSYLFPIRCFKNNPPEYTKDIDPISSIYNNIKNAVKSLVIF